MYNLKEKKFLIVKSFAKHNTSKQRAHICKRDLDQTVENLDTTGKVLAQLLEKNIKEHNSKIDATCTRIDNLKYRNDKTYQSSLLKGNNIPFLLIDKLLKENPNEDWYDVFLKLIE